MKNFLYSAFVFFQKLITKLFFLGAITLAIFSFGKTAFGANIVSQTSYATAGTTRTFDASANRQLIQSLGTGLTGLASEASVYFSVALPPAPNLDLWECSSNPTTNLSGCVAKLHFHNKPTFSDTSPHIYTFSATTGYALDASKYYALVFDDYTKQYTFYGSTSASSYPNGACFINSGIACGNSVVDLYFSLDISEELESCSDGIQDQNETGIDVGGVCELVYLTVPTDSTTTEDFSHWSLGWNGIDATSNAFIVSVHWADNYDIVSACEDFPSGINSGYEACINGATHINADYSASYSGYEIGLSGTLNLPKNTPLVIGNTYYAQVIIQDGNEMGAPIVASGISSFTAGVATGGVVSPIYEQCEGLDVGCYILNALKYLFYPSDVASSRLYGLIDAIKNKPPIGYISGVITALNSIDPEATPTLAFASFTPINDTVFAPLRTGFTWLLWFCFLFVLFKRFLHFQL